MDKKGVNKIIVVIILILISIVALGSLLFFISPFFDKLKDSDDFLNEDCFSEWECGDWTDCEITYNLETLLSGVVLTGTKMRGCSDIKGCVASKIEIEECDTGGIVYVETFSEGSNDYIKIYDEGGNLISEVEIIEGKLFINIIIVS